MRKNLGNIIAMASMFEAMAQSNIAYDEPQRSVVPNFKPSINYKSKNTGYKNYQFTKDGNFDTKSILENEIVFTCVAKSDREAFKKFNEFNNKK